MLHAIYHDLAPWYRLLDPPEDHQEDADCYAEGFATCMTQPAAVPTLLELGSGAGNNALWLKDRFDCTLADVSEPMLTLSRALNPQCRHVNGDMRSLRLGEQFDAVLIHDAICYMTSEADLQAALLTAFTHVRPGGSAIFAPDCVRESFCESTEVTRGAQGQRALRCMYWTWDPDPQDCTYQVDYALLLRDGTRLQALHESHFEGLFAIADWIRLIRQTGFTVQLLPRPSLEAPELTETGGYFDQIFLCQRPG